MADDLVARLRARMPEARAVITYSPEEWRELLEDDIEHRSNVAAEAACEVAHDANAALDLEEAADLIERLTCETCDGAGHVNFCPDPSDSNCGGCEEAPCPACGHLRVTR